MAAPASVGCRILVIDDEEILLRITRKVLGRMKYEVLVATTAAAALATLDRCGGKVQRVLVDVTLPDADGLLLAHEIHRRYPEIRIILTTGGSEPLTREFPFLAKPFSIQQLLNAVACLIGIAQLFVLV
jgi:DNA-binding NtrC family response regulator